jgi:hypothetical protein
MANVVSLVSVLGRINPAIYDVIFPHGPRVRTAVSRFSDAAADLNPQPLPPRDELLMASAIVARDIAYAAINAEAAGNDGGARMIVTAIDDWCGNGRPPIPIPWPGPWPFAFSLDDTPRELDVAGSRVVGALSFAAVASRLPAGKLRDALTTGSEKLMEVGLGQTSKTMAVGR